MTFTVIFIITGTLNGRLMREDVKIEVFPAKTPAKHTFQCDVFGTRCGSNDCREYLSSIRNALEERACGFGWVDVQCRIHVEKVYQ